MLLCVAVSCRVSRCELQSVESWLVVQRVFLCVAVCCCVLQNAEVCCSMLQRGRVPES